MTELAEPQTSVATPVDRDASLAPKRQVTNIYTPPVNAVATLLIWTHVLAHAGYLQIDLEGQQMIERVTKLAQVSSVPFASHGGYINSDLPGILISTAMRGNLINTGSPGTLIAVIEATLSICRLIEKAGADSELQSEIFDTQVPRFLTHIDMILASEPTHVLSPLNIAHVCAGVLKYLLLKDGVGPYQESEFQSAFPTIAGAGDVALEKYLSSQNNLCPGMCR